MTAINGTPGDDTINDIAGNDTLNGLGGNDAFIMVNGGNDTVNGGDGDGDWVSYESYSSGVTINSITGIVTDNFGNVDTLVGIEGWHGSHFNDDITIDDTYVFGRKGNDTFHLGPNGGKVFAGSGDDTIIGGSGEDSVSYFDDSIYWNADVDGSGLTTHGVIVNLSLGTATDGWGDHDTLSGIEDVEGSQFADTITGDAGANHISGDDGNDTINGGGVTVVQDWDVLDGGAGNDTITIIGQGEAHGGAGNDRIIGISSGNVDDLDFAQASYWGATTGIVANLTATSNGGLAGGDATNGFRVADGQGGVDLVSGLHVMSGTQFEDIYYVDSTWTNSFGNWVEIMMGAGDDQIVSLGADVVRLNYREAAGALLIDLAAGTATDRNASYNFIGDDTFSGVNQARGTAFDDRMLGASGNEQLRGRQGNDQLFGGNGNDQLYGDERSPISGAGNDWIDGGAGADQMYGGGGNDTFRVDNIGDKVFENAGQGSDTVFSSISYALAAGQSIEWLATASQAGTGAINLTGNEVAQTLNGNNGNNVLDGRGGADQMYGRFGNDTFRVDNSGDKVFESAGQGSDTVYASVSYTLAIGQSIELLGTNSVAGTSAINLTGNEFAQTLNGNNGNNVLDGRGGADQMYGRFGNDTFRVDNSGDKVFESAGQGSDTVYASVSYTLAAGQSIERLATASQAGTGAINLTGNEFSQTLNGNSGINTLNGGGGNDTLFGNGGSDALIGGTGNDMLSGGAGNDRFVFNTALNASSNRDTITDYNAAADTIQLENAVFTALAATGTLAASAFHIGSAAADASDRIIYNSATGALSYDSDGTGSHAAVQFATLAHNLAITNADFLVT